MIKQRKFLTISLILILLQVSFITNTTSKTIVGNSTFPAEEDDSFIWRCVNSTGPKHNINDLTKFVVDSIYNETFETVHSLIVNYSIDEYDVIKGLWIRNQNNLFYLAYNATQKFLNWSEIAYSKANIYLVPTPVNFTLIGEAVKSAGTFNYTFNEEMITFDYGNGTKIEITINSNGISTIIESFNFTKTLYRWELNEDEIIIIIPLGNYFYLFTIVSIGVIFIVTRKKIISEN